MLGFAASATLAERPRLSFVGLLANIATPFVIIGHLFLGIGFLYPF
jgi:hypothetical protein